MGLDERKSKLILDESAKLLPAFRMDLTPPQNALAMYERISQLLSRDDIYKEFKERSISSAKESIPYARELIKKSSDIFLTATKIAVAGNVIDLASQVRFDLKSELEKVLDIDFTIDDSSLLYSRLKSSSRVVYLADNAGENVFDTLYIEILKEIFPDIEFYYFVRSRPIINDITYSELKDDPINELATLIDSGIRTPGVIVENLNKEAKELFLSADCIISKGMGNYECLNHHNRYPIFFLLKVKCSVVASAVGAEIGTTICKCGYDKSTL